MNRHRADALHLKKPRVREQARAGQTETGVARPDDARQPGDRVPPGEPFASCDAGTRALQLWLAAFGAQGHSLELQDCPNSNGGKW